MFFFNSEFLGYNQGVTELLEEVLLLVGVLDVVMLFMSSSTGLLLIVNICASLLRQW